MSGFYLEGSRVFVATQNDSIPPLTRLADVGITHPLLFFSARHGIIDWVGIFRSHLRGVLVSFAWSGAKFD